MSDQQFDEQEIRNYTRRALQLMNHYSLTEFEYEDKNSDESITIRRSDTENSPPLLEGRSKQLAGQIQAPTVGKLNWKTQENSFVESGEIVAEILKKDEVIPVKPPGNGKLTECKDVEYVEFGEVLAVIVPQAEEESENG